MALLPDAILARILESLYVDFLAESASDDSECIDVSKHHCSLLHPCIPISKSPTFQPIYTFRLISSNWNKVFLSTAELDRYGSHRFVQGPYGPHKYYDYIFHSLRKSVVFRRYRIFQNIDTQHGTSLIVFFGFLQLTYYYQRM